jgi:hypothetical protein
MSLRTVEEKIDDAVYAVFDVLGLSVADNIDASVAINEAITPIAEKLVTDDEEDEVISGRDSVVSYGIQVSKDARVYYRSIVVGSMADIMNGMTRHATPATSPNRGGMPALMILTPPRPARSSILSLRSLLRPGARVMAGS